MLAALAVVLAAVALFHQFSSSSYEATRAISVVCLLGTTLFAVCIPILLRTGHYQKALASNGLSPEVFYRMKRFILSSVGIGSIFAILAYFLPIYRYHLYLTALAAIYGIYSILPTAASSKRDRKGFGVKEDV